MNILTNKSRELGIPLYLCGGVCRDKLMGRLDHISDLDFTSGDNRVSQLAQAIAFEVRKVEPNTHTKVAADGHVSIHIGSLKTDFSSNFNVPGIQKILTKMGISPTPLNCEMWSRDFTCNALLMNLDMVKIKDITKKAIPDIQAKLVRTVLDPDTTFRYNTKRIIRVIYMATKLGFEVSPDIIRWVSENAAMVGQGVDQSYLTKNINKSLMYDKDKTIDLLNRMNLWNYIPVTDELYPYYTKYTGSKMVSNT